MNIGMISYWSSPLARVGIWEAGGMNVYISGLAMALTQLGHTVDIFTRCPPSENNKITKVSPRLRVIHFCMEGKDLYANIPNFSNKIQKFIVREKIKYDIIHTHYYYSGLVGNMLKNIHIPIIHNFHSYGMLKLKHLGIDDTKRIETEKKICSTTDAILASTPIEKNEIVTYYKANPKKIFVIPPGIDHRIFKPYDKTKSRNKLNLDKEKIYILFVGRIDPVKGIPILIQAVNLILKDDHSLSNRLEVLLIGGDISSKKFWRQEEVKIIKGMIKEKKLGKNIRFIGSRSNNILPFYYNASDIVVLPSSFESFGLVILEAMACKACVVASEAGGPEYIIHNKRDGFLFGRDKVKELATTLNNLIKFPRKRREVGEHALTRSLDFCWSSQAEKITELYQKIINKNEQLANN